MRFISLATGSAASGAAGTLVLLWLFLTENPVSIWARQRPCPHCQVAGDSAGVVLALLMIWAALAFGSACAAMIAQWLRRIRSWPRASTVIVTFIVAAFLGGLLIEVQRLVHLILSGDLTADDATGALLDGGAITFHGWETVLRRAVLAGAVGSLMGECSSSLAGQEQRVFPFKLANHPYPRAEGYQWRSANCADRK